MANIFEDDYQNRTYKVPNDINPDKIDWEYHQTRNDPLLRYILQQNINKGFAGPIGTDGYMEQYDPRLKDELLNDYIDYYNDDYSTFDVFGDSPYGYEDINYESYPYLADKSKDLDNLRQRLQIQDWKNRGKPFKYYNKQTQINYPEEESFMDRYFREYNELNGLSPYEY